MSDFEGLICGEYSVRNCGRDEVKFAGANLRNPMNAEGPDAAAYEALIHSALQPMKTRNEDLLFS